MSETETYEIRIQGRLAERWSSWFDGMEITAADDGSTLIRGAVADQAALHGLIQKVRDLGLPLLSVTNTQTGNTGRSDLMITLDSVTRRYGGFIAVDHVSFTAQPGRVTGFLGPNGAGKSTTMRIIVGLTHPTAGSATVSGRRYVDLPNPGLEVGVLLDASAQHAGRTGREILTIAQRYMGLPKTRVDEMLDLVGLPRRSRRGACATTPSACGSGSGWRRH